MPPEQSGLLQLIATAVTPVVMISTAATLILGINTKHQSMADRLRALTAEHRQAATPQARRILIAQQLRWFERRIHYAAAAHRMLYLAIVLFLFTILLLILAPAKLSWTPAAYTFFVLGVLLMLAAAGFEFMELRWTNLTLRLEMQDVLASTNPAKERAKRD